MTKTETFALYCHYCYLSKTTRKTTPSLFALEFHSVRTAVAWTGQHNSAFVRILQT